MGYFKEQDIIKQEAEALHTKAMASSHEHNSAQLMLPFVEGDYWYYNKAETEKYEDKLAIDKLLKDYADEINEPCE
tara:strand:- start:335 stop:562 length:228 start_codon:yes stop_codon:yes gene_type:complete